MKILAIEKENDGIESKDYKPFLPAEAEAVWSLYKQNVIREIYFDKESSSAVIMLECSSKSEAQKELEKLPLVLNKIIHFDLFELSPYTGYGRLMKNRG